MWSFLSDKEKLILLSGIFEGEGTFGYHKNGKYRNGKIRHQIQACVGMSDKDVVYKFLEFFKCGSICEPSLRSNHHKQIYKWRVTGERALFVIHEMIPYLGIRRQGNYYGMVQSIRNGDKDWSPYILQPSKNKTSDVRCSVEIGRSDGSRRERIRG
jgi:hypothetical protein